MTVIRMEPGETEDQFIARVVFTAPPLSDDAADEVWSLLRAAGTRPSGKGVV